MTPEHVKSDYTKKIDTSVIERITRPVPWLIEIVYVGGAVRPVEGGTAFAEFVEWAWKNRNSMGYVKSAFLFGVLTGMIIMGATLAGVVVWNRS